MNIFKKLLSICFGITLVFLAGSPVVYADIVDPSANSITQWHAEGNVRCSDYFSNAQSVEISTSSIPHVLGAETELTGDDNPLDGDTTDETVTMKVERVDASGNPLELSFLASTKINAVIVKKGREVNFYAMPTGGRGGDSELDLETGVADDGVDGLEIDAVSFCYGISINEEPPADTLSACPLDSVDETYCGEGEAFECNVVDGRLECCSCNGDLAGCLIDEESTADGGCGSITFTELHPAFTGKGSDIVCYQTKKGLTCWEY